MRSFPIFAIIIFLTMGCGNKKTANLPPAPANADTVAATIKRKKFKANQLALVSTLISDKNNPYEWFDEIKDTTAFFRNYEKQKMKLKMSFINDSTVELTDEATITKATWRIDSQPKTDETPGKFLRLSMERGDTLFPGQSGKSTITFSYKILGLDDKQLFLETPNIFNSRKMAVLMKAE